MNKKIFVGGLSFKTNEQSLQVAFERFGIISDIRLVIDRATGRSKGFAFISFESEMAAEVAVNQMNSCQIDGRPVKVSAALERDDSENDGQAGRRGNFTGRDHGRERGDRDHGRDSRENPTSKVYVGGLFWESTEDALRDAFANCGPIEELTIVKDKITGLSKGFAFITFTDHGSAEKAVLGMNGHVLDDKELRVSLAQERHRGPAPRGRGIPRR